MMTQTLLKELLRYDSKTGKFYWLHDMNAAVKANMEAGTISGKYPDDGYIKIVINKHPYKAHRLAWLYEQGEFPLKLIDHINRDRTDNRIENLRLATDAINSKNQSIYKNNVSGYHGVTKHGKRWRARININGKKVHLGVFDTIEEAAECRRKVELEYGFHINHGNYKSLTTIPQGSTLQVDGEGNSKNPI